MIYQRLLEQRARVTPGQKRAFARQIDRLIRQTGKVEAKKVEAMVDLLQKAKSSILDQVRDLPSKATFSRAMGRQLKDEIDRLLGQFAVRAARELAINEEQFARMGLEFTEDMLKARGIKPSAKLSISPELVENAAERSADLIRSLTQAQLGRANEIINVGVISGRSVFEVADEMSGAFGKSLAQMEAIARTEMLGIHSQVEMAQLLDMTNTFPGLHKQWVSVGDDRTRLGHLLSADEGGAHMQTVPVNEPFRVPLTVTVKGREELGEVEDMMYPRDPAASPGNVINCRCTMVPDFETEREQESMPLTARDLPPVRIQRPDWAVKITARAGSRVRRLYASANDFAAIAAAEDRAGSARTAART